MEDSGSKPLRKTNERIRKKMIDRVKRLSNTKLNLQNLFLGHNEHALSVKNYHIGVLRLKQSDLESINRKI